MLFYIFSPKVRRPQSIRNTAIYLVLLFSFLFESYVKLYEDIENSSLDNFCFLHIPVRCYVTKDIGQDHSVLGSLWISRCFTTQLATFLMVEAGALEKSLKPGSF